MNTEHYRRVLEAKQKELMDELAHAGAESLEGSAAEVQDETDMAVGSEAKDLQLIQNTQAYDLLTQVHDALARIDSGTYGKCLACGKPIPQKRLDAVPWTAFDLPHQEEEDRAKSPGFKGSTL